MVRRMFNILTSLSLLLSVTVGAMWVHSYGDVADVWYVPGMSTRYFVESTGGLLCFGRHLSPRATESFCVPHLLLLGALAALPVLWVVLWVKGRGVVKNEGFPVMAPQGMEKGTHRTNVV